MQSSTWFCVGVGERVTLYRFAHDVVHETPKTITYDTGEVAHKTTVGYRLFPSLIAARDFALEEIDRRKSELDFHADLVGQAYNLGEILSSD